MYRLSAGRWWYISMRQRGKTFDIDVLLTVDPDDWTGVQATLPLRVKSCE